MVDPVTRKMVRFRALFFCRVFNASAVCLNKCIIIGETDYVKKMAPLPAAEKHSFLTFTQAF